ncbi:MAG: hypothetical protein COW42_03390 [Deltaproteobacteria bacterium CG17_big_fil_post_rev_8_21_14_2_50_63_7]|nr:MAG: hypothetical protein COW42_03390 [Deltaproteobacteria bacterium CG17_big_fil_post_rev_8_21_14_2_50_63_7]
MWVAQSAWPANFAQTNLPPGTMELANSLQNEVVARVRANWDPAWTDHGVIGANFGELRAIRNAWYEDVNTHNISPPVSVPAALMEVAYHDTAYDASLLRTLEYRQDVARGLLVGLIRALNGPNAPLPPLSPTHVSATTTVEGLHVRWRAVEDPLATQASPTRFNVYLSADGVLFSPVPVVVEGATEVVLPLADCDTLYVKVSAANDGGESLDSAIVGGKRPSLGGARLLYVDGVDRESQLEADPVNQRSYTRIYGPALTDALAGAGFDTALDEAVEEAVLWAHYDLVVWATSETSTRRLSVDPSQRQAIDLLTASGTPLVISGAELGWHLVERGTVEEKAFFEGVLGARYLNDDAGSTVVDASRYALDSSLVFGDCSADAVCVEYPDLLDVAPGGEVVLTYDNGGAAAVRAVGRDIITAGFPLEAIADAQQRHDLIAALAAELLAPALASEGVCVAPSEPELEPEPELAPEELEAEPDVAEGVVEDPMDLAEVPVEGAAEAVEVADIGPDASVPPKNKEDGCSCAVSAAKRPLSKGLLSALSGLLLGLWATRRRR